MSKPTIPINLKAVSVFKVKDSFLLSEAILITIEDGRVVDVEYSTRGGDSLNVSLACASRDLAIVCRTNQGVTRHEVRKAKSGKSETVSVEPQATDNKPATTATPAGQGREPPRPNSNNHDRGHNKGGPGKRT